MKESVKRIIALLLLCCIAMTTVTVSTGIEAEAASFTYSQNVSSSKVTKSSTSGSMPSSVSTVKGGRYYYFNLQTSDDYYITSAALYVKDANDSDYTREYYKTFSVSDDVHYVAASYCINNTSGTLKYYWRIDYKTSSSSSKTVKETSTKSITVTAKTSVTSTYNSALNDFLSVSCWANNASWGDSKTCQSSSWSASGCCAYVADLVYELYGAKSPSSGTSFTSVDDIRAGDVLKLKNSSTGESHWIYVYGRDGDELYVVAGNEYNSKSDSNHRVALTYNRYTISGSKIKGLQTFTLTKGYHYD